MPRPMGELRRLLLEWNSLVPIAQERGIRRIQGALVEPRAHFQMDRVEARRRVADLRAQVAPFFAPNLSADLSSDTFGVELEFYLPVGQTHETLAAAIRAVGVMCQAEMYGHTSRTYWKVTTDGSLGDFTRGTELVSPPLSGEAGFDALRKVCNLLTSLRCKVNRKCGLHVHVGCRDRNVEFFKSLVLAYRHFEPTIDSILAPSRRGANGGDGFCQSSRIDYQRLVNATTVREVGIASGQTHFDHTRSSSRYRKLNLMSFVPYGTVEFRQHQGTVEARKAEMWVRLCMRVVKAAEQAPMAQVTARASDFDGLASFTGMTEIERQYFAERREFFAAATNPQQRRVA